MELEDVLSDKEPEAPPPAVEQTVEEVREEGRQRKKAFQEKEADARAEGEGKVRDPVTGQFKPKEAPKEEAKEEVKAEVKQEKPPAQEMSEKERAFLQTAQEERRKRQELERRLEALEKSKPQTEAEKKTFWDDPEGHFKQFEQKLAQQSTALTLNVSERIARSKYQDFDAGIEVFGEILRGPGGAGIHAQWLASPDPAEFAYQMGKKTRELREVGNIDALREKIEKETRAKVEAEYKQKQEELEKKREAIPPSLSDVRGGGAKASVAWAGPPSLDDILKK